MKNCYRPVRIIKHDGDNLEFYNYKCFTKADYTVKWQYILDGNVVQEGEITLDIEPRSHQNVKLDIQHANGDEALVFTYLDGDFEVAKEQIVNFSDDVKTYENTEKDAPIAEMSEKRIFVYFNSGEFIFDTASGEVVSYKKDGREYINTRMNNMFDTEELKEEVPLGRLGTPEEIAQAVLFLAESPYITGQILGVNGGAII